MRIDSNQEAQRAAETERSSNQPQTSATAAPSSSAASALGEDQAELSGFHLEVQSLVAQVAGLPETSAGKVAALRQAVVTGSYRPSPDQVAGAMFSNMVKLAA
jgi:flagellar biosynthesis anti-sigma factor FlgM